MIKVKTERINELTEKFGFTMENHPQVGLLYMHKEGMVFGPQGQFAGLAMPLPLATAKLIAALYDADMLMEDTGIIAQASPQPAPKPNGGIIL